MAHSTATYWLARYGYRVGGEGNSFNWFWVRDEYTPNEAGWATRFDSKEAARRAAAAAAASAVAIQPHLIFRTAVEARTS